MSQFSLFWDNTGGDVPLAGYSSKDFAKYYSVLGDSVFPVQYTDEWAFGDGFVLNFGENFIEVGSGAALVDGTFYLNDNVKRFDNLTEGTYKIILRKVWSDQVVRMHIKPNPYQLIKEDGNIYEIALYDVVFGLEPSYIVLYTNNFYNHHHLATDINTYLAQKECMQITTEQLEDECINDLRLIQNGFFGLAQRGKFTSGFFNNNLFVDDCITSEKFSLRERKIFLTPCHRKNDSAGIIGWLLPDGVSSYAAASFITPSTHQVPVTGYAVVYCPTTSGKARVELNARWAPFGSPFPENGTTTGYSNESISTNLKLIRWFYTEIPPNYLVTLRLTRQGADSGDTLAGDLHLLGFFIQQWEII